MKTYQVRAKRWEHGWELHIEGVGVTQSRTLWDAEDMARRARERREELTVLAFDALLAESELVARGLPFEVGQERVVAHGRGESAFRQAEDDHEVEVEPDAHADRADEHAVAEAADASEVGFELERERAREHIEAG